MAAIKERMQNVTITDTVNLRLFTYNSNNLADVNSVEKVSIYFLDPSNRTTENPDGRVLIEEFDGSAVTAEDVGKYLLPVTLDSPKYQVGRFIDVWTIQVVADEPNQTATNCFDVYSQLWYTTPIPVVYDLAFHFQPNKMRKGTKQYIIIEVTPNVPRASDLKKYYENLVIVSDMTISMEQACGPCVPEESDLRLVIDEEPVTYREKRYGYYQIDTTDMDCGIYNVWFKINLGTNIFVSDKMQFQVYE